MIKLKLVSSLEKAFVDEKIEKFKSLERLSALRGERVSFQLLYISEGEDAPLYSKRMAVTKSGELSELATLRNVVSVPVERTTNFDSFDDNYLRLEPGIFPDILMPLHYGGCIVSPKDRLHSVWIEIDIPKDAEAKEYKLAFGLEGVGEASLTLEVIAATLPESEIKFTQWFHCDSLAHYYRVDMWSDEHWKIVRNFMKTAVRNGINMILTPTFTPPLDTAIGGERLTAQLVSVKLSGGEYEFDFTLLDKWVDMADEVGVKYFEIAHFFTQWGAGHAPKVMATVDGEYKKIFGWETDATSPEYRKFLRAFLTKFLAHMKSRGDDKRCYFHISDEPHIEHMESYKAAREIVADLLQDYTIMDALSSFEFHKHGITDMAIPGSNHIDPFIEAGVKGLWTYYCCAQSKDVSNRFIAMPSYRTRSIGIQMFKFDIVGFLQWGYNFYMNFHSCDPINPYIQQDGDDWIPAGDAFSVYPAPAGDAYESLRIIVFHEALQDISAMKLLEKYIPKERIVELIEKRLGKELRFDVCARCADEILDIRESVNALIKEQLDK